MSNATPKILIVDDNPDLIGILEQLLSRDFEVFTARTGEDGIALAVREKPDLVILDLQLPGMDGMEAGRWIKSKLAPAHVPILALTALAGNGDLETILTCGCCDAYLAKPAALAAIRAKVGEMLTPAFEAEGA
jgi:two-component system cell cycle response regulator DivK